MGRVRLKDIAAKTGFSISTVSRVLSGDTSRKNSDATVEKIITCAEELGYFHSRLEILSQFKTPFRIASIFVSAEESAAPFFSEIFKGIKGQALLTQQREEVHYRLLFINQPDFAELLETNSFDAAVILGRGKQSIIDFIKTHVPICVYAGLNSIGDSDEVLCDARAGMRDAVKILKQKGAKKIAYVGTLNKGKNIINEHRYLGFLEGISEADIDYTEEYSADISLSASQGYHGTKKLFNKVKPDGIVCANDITAIGVIKYLTESGIRVPEDVMVIGFDNIESANYLTPTLSTFDVPKVAMGRFAFSLAYERFKNPRPFNVSVNIPYTFIDRESTKNIGTTAKEGIQHER